MCHVCKIRFPNEEIPSGKHKCWACRNIFDNTEWTKKILSKHRLCQRRIVCTACTILGYTSRDVSTYCCIDCNRNLGHSMYNKYVLQNFKKRDDKLTCLECGNKCKCTHCGRRFEWCGHKKRQKTGLCQECKESGYTMRHTETYTCTACKKSAGYSKFNAVSSAPLYPGKKMLMCIECQVRKTKKKRKNRKPRRR